VTPRTHRERLLYDLNECRGELEGEMARVAPEDFAWAPVEGMRTYRGQIKEIGSMEAMCVSWLARQVPPREEEAVAWSGEDKASMLADLGVVRVQTLAYLADISEEQLQTPVALPESWREYFPVTHIEPEELIRWVIRHEYYHLGQIVTYNWMRGDNPYRREG
jgi:hypothetical protein